MNAWEWGLSCLWGTAAGGLAWYVGTIARQITYVTLADGRRQERRLPLIFRLLLPLTPNLVPWFSGPRWTRPREYLDRRLVAAGFEGLLASEEFLALRVLVPAVLVWPWTLFCWLSLEAMPRAISLRLGWALYLLGPIWLLVYPGAWLKRALGRRHRAIQRALPFVLDLLTLSVEAGMDFMTALQRHVERRTVTALDEELIRVIREIQVGKTRRDALRDMSRRVNLPELRSVVNALVQADELGVSIGSILRIQSDQIRQRRFERAEKLANEAPVKMLGPLLFFIFPAVFLILLGPIVYRLIQQGF